MSTEKICTCSETTKCPASCKGKKKTGLQTKQGVTVKCDNCQCRADSCPETCIPPTYLIACSPSKQDHVIKEKSSSKVQIKKSKSDIICKCPEDKCKPTCKKYQNQICDDCDNPNNDCSKACEENKLTKTKSAPTICTDCQNPDNTCLAPCEEKKQSKIELKNELAKSAPLTCDDCENPDDTCLLPCEEKKRAKKLNAKGVQICDQCTNTEPTCSQPCEEKKSKVELKICVDCKNPEHTCNKPCEANKTSKSEMIICTDCSNPEDTCNELCEANKREIKKSKFCNDTKCPKLKNYPMEKQQEPEQSTNCVPECANKTDTPICADCDCNAGCNDLCLEANAGKMHEAPPCDNCDCNAGCSEACEEKKKQR